MIIILTINEYGDIYMSEVFLDWKNFINIKNSAKKNNSTIHNDTK